MRRGGRVFVEHGLIAAHPGEVVHVAGLRHADDGVDQQVRLRFAGGAEGQFLVRAVQRVAGLEGHDAAPAQLAEIGAQLIGRVAAGAEIVVHWLLDAGHRTAEVDVACRVVQVVHRRVGEVIGAKDLLGLARFVRGPFVGHRHGAEDDAFLVAERDVLAKFDGLQRIFRLHPA